MIEVKKCKGQNKAKNFIGCGNPTPVEQRVYGLCRACMKKWIFTTKEGQNYLSSVQIQAKKTVERKYIKADNELREKLKTLGQLRNEARRYFQKYIRLRDAKLPCISCGTFDSNIWDGGHFYKAELYSGLVFDERNCHKQCRKCNSYEGGNENLFRLGLIDRYGMNFVLLLDADAKRLRQYKFTRIELKNLKKKYQLKIRNHE